VQVASVGQSQNLYPATDPITSITDEQTKSLVSRIDAETRELDNRIEQVIVSLSSSQDLVLIAAADGTLAADVRPLVRLNVSIIVEQDGRREQGYSGGGARADLNYFLDGDLPMDYAREAVRQAIVQLDAQPAAVLASRLRLHCAPSLMMAHWLIAVVHLLWMMRVRRVNTTSWLKTAYCVVICRTN
jgi:TldD protein